MRHKLCVSFAYTFFRNIFPLLRIYRPTACTHVEVHAVSTTVVGPVAKTGFRHTLIKMVYCLGYGMDDPRSQDTIPGYSKKCICSEMCSGSFWRPNSLQFHARGIPSIKCILKNLDWFYSCYLWTEARCILQPLVRKAKKELTKEMARGLPQ